MMWIVLGVIVLLAVAAVFLVARRKPKNYAGADVYRSLMGNPAAAPPALDPKLEPLRQNLRVKLLYQEEKVNGAIDFERERNPTGTTEDWLKAAIARWERDNQ